MLARHRRPVRARLLPYVCAAHSCVSDVVHCRTAAIWKRGPGLGCAFPLLGFGKQTTHDLWRWPASARRTLREGPCARFRKGPGASREDSRTNLQRGWRDQELSLAARGHGDHRADYREASALLASEASTRRPAVLRHRFRQAEQTHRLETKNQRQPEHRDDLELVERTACPD